MQSKDLAMESICQIGKVRLGKRGVPGADTRQLSALDTLLPRIGREEAGAPMTSYFDFSFTFSFTFCGEEVSSSFSSVQWPGPIEPLL